MASSQAPAPGDIDPIETKEWLDAIRSVIKYEGPDRAQFLLHTVNRYLQQQGLPTDASLTTPYINTIPTAQEAEMPDDGAILEKITNVNRWNAIAMVMRAGKVASELGGHIASYAAAATLYEVGFNHFFHARNSEHGGDLVYFQGHSSPGIYARAFLEGRINESQVKYFRQEIFENGLSSYPHPWLMPDFWQFPTVSMGLGPLMSIYQAQFLRYLEHRGFAKTSNRKLWVFVGDGEMGEPESLGALNLAGREKLDNLIFVMSCNLQRLDGPVWGNGQIIQEYESVFRGAGWNVIKVIWGYGWDALFEKDTQGLLLQRFGELVDGEYQNYCAKDGAYMREHFFGTSPELLALVEDKTDAQLKELLDGGHDPQKVFAAYQAAVDHTGQPTVILAKTVKGFGMGAAGEAKNVTHQTKKMNLDALKAFRDRFDLPLSDQDLEALKFLKFDKDSPEEKYLHGQRKKLGGYVPKRDTQCEKLSPPPMEAFHVQTGGSGEREISSTMAFVRTLSVLLKDDTLKSRIVPILADESRTFGMEGLFRQIGIYAPFGQLYEPEDRKQLMYYREDQTGQLLQQGLTEPGAMSSWIAAATSYATNGVPVIPFYIYYSMFGFQRVGDLAWAAGDMRARGFIIGGTAGRTTLAGEGLQHQDGHNLLMFSAVPNCISYDPTFNYEMAVIIREGIRRMFEAQDDVYYYITAMNENYQHPPMPEGAEAGIIKGMYLFRDSSLQSTAHVQLMGSGTILREVIKAADILEKDYNVAADIWSVTSFNELRKNNDTVERRNRLHLGSQRKTHVSKCLEGRPGPVIAATDYMRLYADQIRSSISQRYVVLGTDGFGRSDTRVALRDYFEVDAKMVVFTTLKALSDDGQFDAEQLPKVINTLGIDIDRVDPWKH